MLEVSVPGQWGILPKTLYFSDEFKNHMFLLFFYLLVKKVVYINIYAENLTVINSKYISL